MVRIVFIALVISFLFAGCATQQFTEEGLPIIKVDDQHLSMDNYPGKVYKIQPGEGFVLDVSGYKFRIPQSLGIDTVNEIQIATSPDQVYSIPIQHTKTQYTVTKETLSPKGQTLPFENMKDGESITVGVGYAYPDGRFYPAWIGIISVKGAQP